MNNTLENLGKVLGLTGTLALSSCDEPEIPRREDFYENFQIPLPPGIASEMDRIRGDMDSSIGCFVDTKSETIHCHVPKEDAPWRGRPM